jgi:hypothetical protein
MEYNLHLKYLQRLLEDAKGSLKTVKEKVGGDSKNLKIATEGIEKGLELLTDKEIQNNGKAVKEIFNHLIKKENIGFVEKWLGTQIKHISELIKRIDTEEQYSTEKPSTGETTETDTESTQEPVEKEESVESTGEPVNTPTENKPEVKKTPILFGTELNTDNNTWVKSQTKANHNSMVEFYDSGEFSIILDETVIRRILSMPDYFLIPIINDETGDGLYNQNESEILRKIKSGEYIVIPGKYEKTSDGKTKLVEKIKIVKKQKVESTTKPEETKEEIKPEKPKPKSKKKTEGSETKPKDSKTKPKNPKAKK